MHIVLTDLLTCPRCGPEFGLILLAERVAERRVVEGALGCSNCRERYAVRGGFADLTWGDSAARASEVRGRGTREAAFRLAALLGATDATGFRVIVGSESRHAPALAALIQGAEFVVVDAATRAWEEAAGVSRIAAGPRLPFFSRAARGVVVTRGSGVALEEAARVVAPASRLVYEAAPADAAAILEGAGMELLVRAGDVVVAARKFA